MTLHTVNKVQSCLQRCISMAAEEDAILLIEDGVYAARSTQENISRWENTAASLKLYVLANDLEARGITDKMLPRFNAVTWSEFVNLCCENDKVISWG